MAPPSATVKVPWSIPWPSLLTVSGTCRGFAGEDGSLERGGVDECPGAALAPGLRACCRRSCMRPMSGLALAMLSWRRGRDPCGRSVEKNLTKMPLRSMSRAPAQSSWHPWTSSSKVRQRLPEGKTNSLRQAARPCTRLGGPQCHAVVMSNTARRIGADTGTKRGHSLRRASANHHRKLP